MMATGRTPDLYRYRSRKELVDVCYVMSVCLQFVICIKGSQ